MSCPIHDRCTCYAASLHYTASLTTASSQLVPQTSNILVGYEWAAPLVPTSTPWYPFESVLIQSPTSRSGQEFSGSVPLHNSYHPEHCVYEREQKTVLPSREQFATQHAYPTQYIQGVTRMTMPNNHSEMLFQSHRNYSGLSVIHPDQSLAFDEPPPPYPNNSLPISPFSDVFSQSALLPTDRLLNVEPITYSPLAPVPLRHSSLYHVLKQESPVSPAQGTLSGTSSIAHALEPQGSQNTRGSMIGASESALSASQITTTSLSAVAPDPGPHLSEDPTTATSAQALPPVSSATPPCTPVAAQHGSVVTSLQAHTLVLSQPEVTTHDYDTFPRLRKSSRLIQLQLPGFATEDHSAASSPLSPLPSRPSSSMGAPASPSSFDSNTGVNSSFTVPLVGRKRPVLRAKLACIFCRRRKIQCRPLPGDHLGSTCQLAMCEAGQKVRVPEMTWRGRGRRPSHDLDESDYDDVEEEEPPSWSKSRRGA
ncbi:hypothetical protein BGY98DRAFT_973348 [Russula aff. rugulosa BPL654]|nr:hypothetical protein BGY98DRAFT_973348 [Russula aff. rugulosa BPL654]